LNQIFNILPEFVITTTSLNLFRHLKLFLNVSFHCQHDSSPSSNYMACTGQFKIWATDLQKKT